MTKAEARRKAVGLMILLTIGRILTRLRFVMWIFWESTTHRQFHVTAH